MSDWILRSGNGLGVERIVGVVGLERNGMFSNTYKRYCGLKII